MSVKALDCWMAHRLRRWHSNPRLCDRHQNLADHSWGVASLIVQLHPNPSRELILAALMHDAGEYRLGDMPGPAKRQHHHIASCVAAVEDNAAKAVLPEWVSRATSRLCSEERQWLDLCDMLEAVIWAAHNGGLQGDGWDELIADIEAQAMGLRVFDEVGAILSEVGA